LNIIDCALKQGRKTLSEYESKQILSSYHIPVTRDIIVKTQTEAIAAAGEIGYPVVMKVCAADITHKTEKGLVRTDIRNEQEAVDAFDEIVKGAGAGSDASVLVQEMIKGKRELVAGLIRDPQFGHCVMFGLGGIFTEIIEDVTFRLAPLERKDALEMIEEVKAHRILGQVRGMPQVDMDMLVDILINVGNIGVENDAINEIDINPLIINGNKPVAVDALVVLRQTSDALG
jgi:acyl-CoA synthetase (NDP forming)